MYTNSDLTIFHKTINTDGLPEFKALYLQAVFYENNKNANKSAAGFEDADQALILIPYDANYMTPLAYDEAGQPTGKWTVEKKDIVVKGDATTTVFEDLEAEHSDVLSVTSVDERIFGSKAMQHVEVGAK